MRRSKSPMRRAKSPMRRPAIQRPIPPQIRDFSSDDDFLDDDRFGPKMMRRPMMRRRSSDSSSDEYGPVRIRCPPSHCPPMMRRPIMRRSSDSDSLDDDYVPPQRRGKSPMKRRDIPPAFRLQRTYGTDQGRVGMPPPPQIPPRFR